MLSSTFRRLVLVALVPAALFGSMLVASPASAAVTSTQTLEQQIVGYTNYQRKAHGCSSNVRIDNRLTLAARGHSYFMASSNKFSHTGFKGSSFGYRITSKGYAAPLSENLAQGYPDAAKVIYAWLASPGHRKNLLDCRAKAIGVGVWRNAAGKAFYTQDFGWR